MLPQRCVIDFSQAVGYAFCAARQFVVAMGLANGFEQRWGMKVTRRQVLWLAARTGAGALAAWSLTAHAESSCTDAEENEGLRQSLNYVEASSDPKKTCAVCAFFTAEAGAHCGRCQILNGAANPAGHCDSFSPKQ
jgi:hypothetical protein